MKAVRIHEHGTVDVLRYEEIPKPNLNSGEILVEVKAISINHFDILSRKGIYPKLPLPRVLGMDCAGVVVESNALSSSIKIGDKVLILGETLGLGGAGAYSDFINIPENEVFLIPDGMSFQEASAIGISYLTAWYGLTNRVTVTPEDWILIPGASGGVASAAIQIAKYFGAKVIATSRSQALCDEALKLGADYAIDSGSMDVVKEVKRLTDKRGVDLVFNAVGGETITQSMNTLKKKRGTLVIIGSAAGRKVEIDIFDLLIREMNLLGLNFGGLLPEERGKIYEEVKSLFASGKLKVILDQTFQLSEVQAAHRHIESGKQFGKVILIP